MSYGCSAFFFYKNWYDPSSEKYLSGLNHQSCFPLAGYGVSIRDWLRKLLFDNEHLERNKIRLSYYMERCCVFLFPLDLKTHFRCPFYHELGITQTRVHNIPPKSLLNSVNRYMWHRVWAKQDIHMTMHQWSVTSTLWGTSVQIYMNLQQMNLFIKKQKNLLMLTIITFVHRALMVTEPHMKQGRQHNG